MPDQWVTKLSFQHIQLGFLNEKGVLRIKEEKSWLPVDVRGSKTSVLKLPIAMLLRTFSDKKLKIIFRMAQTKYGGNVVSDHNLTDCSTPAELQIDAWCVQPLPQGLTSPHPLPRGWKEERGWVWAWAKICGRILVTRPLQPTDVNDCSIYYVSDSNYTRDWIHLGKSEEKTWPWRLWTFKRYR